MADIYDRALALAARQLAPRPKGKGAPCILRVSVPGVRNPATGVTSPTTITDYPCTGLRTSYTARDVDGTRILATDVRLLLTAEGQPRAKPGNLVQFDGGQWYTVQDGKELNFAGLGVLHVVQGRAS